MYCCEYIQDILFQPVLSNSLTNPYPTKFLYLCALCLFYDLCLQALDQTDATPAGVFRHRSCADYPSLEAVAARGWKLTRVARGGGSAEPEEWDRGSSLAFGGRLIRVAGDRHV